uniref:Candidate secreted effector n=1 Tax=Meloidogyne incognita TaxID=6306 RepID=A0A914N265_MELIC
MPQIVNQHNHFFHFKSLKVFLFFFFIAPGSLLKILRVFSSKDVCRKSNGYYQVYI